MTLLDLRRVSDLRSVSALVMFSSASGRRRGGGQTRCSTAHNDHTTMRIFRTSLSHVTMVAPEC